ncbi:unnamed protein product [Closterium sp. NIES-65]|nr:unnamed protein product [Closterium sp. NIES-65]
MAPLTRATALPAQRPAASHTDNSAANLEAEPAPCALSPDSFGSQPSPRAPPPPRPQGGPLRLVLPAGIGRAPGASRAQKQEGERQSEQPREDAIRGASPPAARARCSLRQSGGAWRGFQGTKARARAADVDTGAENARGRGGAGKEGRRTAEQRRRSGGGRGGAAAGNRGAWTAEEDERLAALVAVHGAKNWSAIAAGIPGRPGKSCRLRWCNQLDPALRRGQFTVEEDARIITAHPSTATSGPSSPRTFPNGACLLP